MSALPQLPIDLRSPEEVKSIFEPSKIPLEIEVAEEAKEATELEGQFLKFTQKETEKA